MRRYADRFDAAEQVRIVGGGTDLTLSLAGRHGEVDEGHTNMPGGEFFYSPLEDSAEGVIEFSEFPAGYQGHSFAGIRLVFEGGAVVDASATRNETTSTRCSTATRARGASASSGSAATRASRGR